MQANVLQNGEVNQMSEDRTVAFIIVEIKPTHTQSF